MTELFDKLTPQEQIDLRARGRTRTWARGEIVFTQGDPSTWVLLVLSGKVKISAATESGTDVVLAVRGPGAVVGEMASIDGQPRSATVTAVEPVEGLAIRDFAGFLRENGRVAVLIMRTVTERLRDADRKRIEYGVLDTAVRVANRLVELAERYGEPVPGGVSLELPLSQDELASWVGSSREAVNKALRGLRDRGLIETGRRRVLINDMDGLRRRARQS
ncbi:helix-turn-helix domain-containing protein [Herbidospora sp. NEAU-GS84]|uniref:Helix-turn-helix domain-containing protein n=1 Tax=Herbidospora solisilvae TaxID=2696284 RepID=A0A7C9NH59_9ACTN|nr:MULTISPECIES: Crp/Fnr family transcriptional regulator [Herbidospora]NAS22372.1 helix-turn-helix domain-containing protein [Herbidospora solisilvae]GLX96376.1 Crp/Fnr family transcriptional regulator [Herbidospora sp. NBRC 101105]